MRLLQQSPSIAQNAYDFRKREDRKEFAPCKRPLLLTLNLKIVSIYCVKSDAFYMWGNLFLIVLGFKKKIFFKCKGTSDEKIDDII